MQDCCLIYLYSVEDEISNVVLYRKRYSKIQRIYSDQHYKANTISFIAFADTQLSMDP